MTFGYPDRDQLRHGLAPSDAAASRTPAAAQRREPEQPGAEQRDSGRLGHAGPATTATAAAAITPATIVGWFCQQRELVGQDTGTFARRSERQVVGN